MFPEVDKFLIPFFKTSDSIISEVTMADDDDDVDLYADLGGTGTIDDNVSRANLPHSRLRSRVPDQRHSFFRVQICVAASAHHHLLIIITLCAYDPCQHHSHVLPQEDDDAAGDPTDLYADILGPDSDGPSRASSKSSVATPASSVALPPLKPPGVCVLVCVSGVLWSLTVCVCACACVFVYV